MNVTWSCQKCLFKTELPEGKLPPIYEMHPKDGAMIAGTMMFDLSNICVGGDFLKVETK